MPGETDVIIIGAGSSGPGLPLAHGPVELHGGTLQLENTPGEGATVTVTFPSGRALGRGQRPQ